MVLFKGIVPPKGCDEFMYSGQKGLQRFFVLALLCVPWILLAKPNVSIMTAKPTNCLLFHLTDNLLTFPNFQAIPYLQRMAWMRRWDRCQGQHTKDSKDGAPVLQSSEDHDLGEIFIHQGIHTMEYVLGSHAALYL
ncbi:V-type proton ATPase 116 kDa subunit a 1-like [Schistocerca gregaria]|uniref:V-type proton ATPase 116 kDa subunit a 1-like n=1 Tax=Schistocerca gregaria TaxID=7010 RepID=UPI00211DF4DB|nr:V-type proton ATPase 116 kDa subunit a 1-like [Schistocerca gregaria]